MSGPAIAPGSRFVDLHAHSTASDGSRPPAEVIRAAHAAGLQALALTDHDTVDGIPEAEAEGERLGVRVVRGVELSAVEGNVETHLLGLHLAEPRLIAEQLESLKVMRIARAERIVVKLNDLGVRVGMEAVLAQSGEGAVGRPHVARAMVAEGWATDVRDAFDRYLGNGRPAYVGKDQLTLADAIATVHRAGGIAVLAHPGGGGTRARIEQLAAIGLDGVEVLHPSHNAEDQARLRALTDHFGLVASGGSDWHGAAEGPRTIGMMKVPADWLTIQDERVATLRARAQVA
ncbi:MAG: hypothetical protein JWO05_2227 [Gemmatimonadetes bacterium]|nr:hypothetical protein [Gemmatimonadota bacterium]